MIADESRQDSSDANESKGKTYQRCLLLKNPPEVGFSV